MPQLSPRALLRRVPAARRAALIARFGDLRRTRSLTEWGEGRGAPVDRWYIERFLRERAAGITGHVLEVKEDLYASELGAASVDVVDIDPDNALASVVGDLCDPATLAGRSYDAVVLTQTLQCLAEPVVGLRNLLDALRPGGTLLVTVPCASRIFGPGDLWRWTPAGLELQLRSAAGDRPVEIEVQGIGNGLAVRAFIFGLAWQDLSEHVRTDSDPAVPLIVGARVRLLD